VVIENPYFEICERVPSHPYHNKECGRKRCPHYELCWRGEYIEVEMSFLEYLRYRLTKFVFRLRKKLVWGGKNFWLKIKSFKV